MTRSVAGECVEPMSDDVAEAARDQLDPAKDERAHQDLAQLGVGLDERQHLFARQLDHLAGCARPVARNSARRPEIMLTSPVNWPAAWTVIERVARP